MIMEELVFFAICFIVLAMILLIRLIGGPTVADRAIAADSIDLLSDMGMPRSFSFGADFSAMSPDAARLSFVQQDAAIKVDEEGAEAAAISSAGMQKNSAGPADPFKYVAFHADRPFLYIISESGTGAVLFAGRYSAKPQK